MENHPESSRSSVAQIVDVFPDESGRNEQLPGESIEHDKPDVPYERHESDMTEQLLDYNRGDMYDVGFPDKKKENPYPQPPINNTNTASEADPSAPPSNNETDNNEFQPPPEGPQA